MKSSLIAVGLAAIVAACSSAPASRTTPPSAAPSATPNADAASWPSFAPGPPMTLLPDGVYVHTATREGITAAGATGTDVENAGRWTLTVTGADGKLVLHHDDSNPDETWPVHFTVMGDRVHVEFATESLDLRWQDNRDTIDLKIIASDTRFGDHSNDAVAYRILSAILGGEWTRTS